jgi:hypothetical protein
MLDDTRLVFVGRCGGKPDAFYIGFRNAEGKDKKLILSREAWDALCWLHDNPRPEHLREPFPANPRERVRFAWRVAVADARHLVMEAADAE